MPNPKWNKKTICTYIAQEQKKVWEENAIRECKGLADFIRNRVDSTINNKDLSGKYCLWLEIPEDLHNRALNDFKDGRLNPLEELVQHHIYRVVKDDVEKQLLLEQSTNNPDTEALKEQILGLERQIEALKSENESLRGRKSFSDSSNIINVLRDCKTFLTLEEIATLINYDEDDPDLHLLYEKVEDILYDYGMIEWKQGKGYKFNPEIKPVEREPSPRPDLIIP
ncbi:MAG: hypothetical protein WA144_03060 [Candidatus Methanoperedens sp.]